MHISPQMRALFFCDFLIYSFFAHAFISQAVKWRFPTSPEQ